MVGDSLDTDIRFGVEGGLGLVGVDQLGVGRAGGQQLGVGAAPDDASLVEVHDLVGQRDGRLAVGHDHERGVAVVVAVVAERREDAGLDLRVHRLAPGASTEQLRFEALTPGARYRLSGPGVAETLDWARTLLLLGIQQIDAETARSTINILLKYQSDIVKALRELEDTKSEMAKDTAPAAAGS